PWRHLFSTIWIEAGIAALAAPFVFSLLDGGRRGGGLGGGSAPLPPRPPGGRIFPWAHLPSRPRALAQHPTDFLAVSSSRSRSWPRRSSFWSRGCGSSR